MILLAKKKTLTELVEKIEEVLALGKEEVEKFEVKEVNAAGSRVRKALAEIRAISQEGRKLVTEIKNGRKTAKSKKKK